MPCLQATFDAMAISFDKDDAKSLKIAVFRGTARLTHVGQNGLIRLEPGPLEEAAGVLTPREKSFTVPASDTRRNGHFV